MTFRKFNMCKCMCNKQEISSLLTVIESIESLKGSDRQYKVVELRLLHCRFIYIEFLVLHEFVRRFLRNLQMSFFQ